MVLVQSLRKNSFFPSVSKSSKLQTMEAPRESKAWCSLQNRGGSSGGRDKPARLCQFKIPLVDAVVGHPDQALSDSLFLRVAADLQLI